MVSPTLSKQECSIDQEFLEKKWVAPSLEKTMDHFLSSSHKNSLNIPLKSSEQLSCKTSNAFWTPSFLARALAKKCP